MSTTIKPIILKDRQLDLFEGQYPIPDGITYNSYIIEDEKMTLLDTGDGHFVKEWIAEVKQICNDRKLDYLIISHIEPDHSGCIKELVEMYPDITLVGNDKTFTYLQQFYTIDDKVKKLVVKDGDKLTIGKHTFTFLFAPMVHWPEVMMTYEESEQVLFSADAFGKFGITETFGEAWTDEARRYYINICGKYGMQVQMLLTKITAPIKGIYPLHGPILTDDLSFYINKYNIWSKYEAERDGILIAYASIHGNTARAVNILGETLTSDHHQEVKICDLSREDLSEVVSQAFKYNKIILASSTYDGGIFTPMEDFLTRLKKKSFQNRKVGLIENGTWAAQSGKLMISQLEQMKNITLCSTIVSIKSALKEGEEDKLQTLAKEILQ